MRYFSQIIRSKFGCFTALVVVVGIIYVRWLMTNLFWDINKGSPSSKVSPSKENIQYHNQIIKSKYSCVYNDNGNNQGFCSWFNGLLMAFEYATFVNRNFSFNTDTFPYGHWEDYFIVHDASFISTPRVETYIPMSLSFNISRKGDLEVRETMVPRPKTLYFRHIHAPFYQNIYINLNMHLRKAYAKHNETHILRRRKLTRQLWYPRPEIIKESSRIEAFMRSFEGNPARKYVGVHIRRGDKLWGEAKPIPMEKYFNAVMELKKRDKSIDCVLIIADDFVFANNLKIMLTAHRVMAFLLTDFRTPDRMVQKGWNQYSFLKSSKEDRYQHTVGLILSLHILAKSDYVVCTFSSNMCRVVQLIRSQPLDTVKSLDVAWHMY